MFLFLLALWLVFNGRVTAETVLLGLLFAAAIFAFMCRFMDYSLEKDRKAIRLAPLVARYFFVLLAEIVKSTFTACRFIVSPTLPHDPLLVKFRTPLSTDVARVTLANSITLTPGTITVEANGDVFTVHCLSRSLLDTGDSNRMLKLLKKMEA